MNDQSATTPCGKPVAVFAEQDQRVPSLPEPSEGRLDRRGFLRQTTAGAGLLIAAGATAAEPHTGALPTRTLGRTGAKVTVLGLGTAPIGEGPVGLEEAVRIFGAVLDRGVNLIDTARIYGNAEEALGQLIPARRERLFVATKVSTDVADAAERSLAESFRLMKTDYMDLVHIHSTGGRNIDRVLGDGGVLDYLLRQKKAGRIRFVGISGHNRPANFLRMLETGQIDVVMPVMNYADRHIYGFEETVLPECRRQNVGVIAMKVYVGIKGGFPNHRRAHVGCVTQPERLPHALAYALDLEGVAAAVVGPYTMDQALANVEIARRYQPLTTEQYDELLALGRQLAPELGPRYGPVA
jgi:uncharacterized protein